MRTYTTIDGRPRIWFFSVDAARAADEVRAGGLARGHRAEQDRGGDPGVAAVVRRVQRFRLRHVAQTRLWLLPLSCVFAGIGLAVALLSVDRS